MLVARAELSDGCVRDVRILDDAIVAVAERLRPRLDENVIDAGMCAVLPGLHDHHLHLRALAAATTSLDLTTVGDAEALRSTLNSACAQLPPGAWLRAVGYHESIAGDLDRGRLDELAAPDTPIRVQHRTGMLWIFNSAAMAASGLDVTDAPGVDRENGRLWRRDDLVRRTSVLAPDQLAGLGSRASALGVTGFTDATPNGSSTDARDLARDLRAAGVAQRLHLMGPVGAIAPAAAHASLGPVKVLLDDAALPTVDELTETVRAAHAEARGVAFHCVTRVQLVVAIVALDSGGRRPGDRIEHGSVIPPELIADLCRLGVTVVTQPHFVAERGDDYRRDVDPEDRDSLYRVRSLLDAGIPVAAGTDAPFGTFDPWASMAAARERRTQTGHELGAAERIEFAAAMRLYLGRPDDPALPRPIAVGEPADLCVLSVPWRALPDALRERPVGHTFVAGEQVYER